MSDDLVLRQWSEVGDGGEWSRDVRVTSDGPDDVPWSVVLEETFAGDRGAPDFVTSTWVFFGTTPDEALAAAVDWISANSTLEEPAVSPRASVSIDWGDDGKETFGPSPIEIVHVEGKGIVVPPALVDACQRRVPVGIPNPPGVVGDRELLKRIADLAPLHPKIAEVVATKRAADDDLRRTFGDPADDLVETPADPRPGPPT